MPTIERDRDMVKMNEDGTVTVVVVRTFNRPSGPVADHRSLEDDLLAVLRRKAAQFVYPILNPDRRRSWDE